MRMTREQELALYTMICINAVTPTSTKTLIKKMEDLGVKATQNFLEQISRKLRKAGLVRSQKGPGGGIVRTEYGASSVLDILDAVSGMTKNKCSGKASEFVYNEVLRALANMSLVDVKCYLN